MTERIIYPSIEAADSAMPKCPRPLAGSGGYHWWYIDTEEVRKQFESGTDADPDVVPCICKTCSQRMLLSVDAEEFPV